MSEALREPKFETPVQPDLLLIQGGEESSDPTGQLELVQDPQENLITDDVEKLVVSEVQSTEPSATYSNVGRSAIFGTKSSTEIPQEVKKKKSKGSSSVWWMLPCDNHGITRFICCISGECAS